MADNQEWSKDELTQAVSGDGEYADPDSEPEPQDDNGLYVEDEELVFGRMLQRALTREGFPVIGSDSRTPREDGIVDRATLFQVQRFKKSLGMKPTTTLTKAIKRRLGL